MSELAVDRDPDAPAADANRRAHTRLPARDLKNLGARLASGAEIRLIDLSRGGAQFECDRRFLPNSTISLRLVTPDTTFVVSGRVVRSRIVRLDRGGLGYNVAVSFNELLQNLLEEPPPPPPPAVASAPAIAEDEPAMATSDPAPAPDAAPAEAPPPGVSAEEVAAFEATVQDAPSIMTVTASVDQTGDELRDLFNGNDW
jgi:hypothetical protein